MIKLVFYCKTFLGDFERFKQLLNTFHKFNKENITLYVSAPQNEIDSYHQFKHNNVRIITDESFAKEYMTDKEVVGKCWEGSIRAGYINQEICKLTFFKTNVSENYLCLDSDVIFIRDFYVSDFMHDENTPYIVLIMDKDLYTDKLYRQLFVSGRSKMIKMIYDFVGLEDRRIRTCHGMQVFNNRVLASLEEDFMKPKSLSYIDLLAISPYEFTWYNVWFQKCKLIPEYAVEPFFKTLHIISQYTFARLQNLNKEDFAGEYVGIVMNSKWDPPTPLDYENPTEEYEKFYNSVIDNKLDSYIHIINSGHKKSLVNRLVRWIPIRKWRETFRNKYI